MNKDYMNFVKRMGSFDMDLAIEGDEEFKHSEIVDDFLAHYGVLGMKWGVRRYQNKDGTLTSAGKRKQAKQAKQEAKASKKKASSSGASSTNSIPADKKQKKQIRKVKNELLNRVNDYDMDAHDAVEKKTKVKYDEAIRDSKKADEFVSERIRLLNDYSKNNKDKLPPIVEKIEYTKSNVSWDDLSIHGEVTLKNGKKVNSWSSFYQPADNAFLDYIDYVEHLDYDDNYLIHSGEEVASSILKNIGDESV